MVVSFLDVVRHFNLNEEEWKFGYRMMNIKKILSILKSFQKKS